MTNVIETRDLSKTYRNTHALEQFNLSVGANSVFALVGPNGAGKTTTIKLLMNILTPTAGTAAVLGVNTREIQPKHFTRIGYVSENQKLPEWMTVSYFLRYCRGFYPDWDDALAASLVNQLQLPLDRKLKHLSRGMKIKAALASSLAYRPNLLVLDEPFSGLDPLVRDEFQETMLEQISSSDMTVLISSHDLAEIETFATHIGYLDQAKLRFAEPLPDLAARFREVEVVLDQAAAAMPAPWPVTWLKPEASGAVVRFVDTRYAEPDTDNQIRAMFQNVKSVNASPMPLRAIVVAMAKSSRVNTAASAAN